MGGRLAIDVTLPLVDPSVTEEDDVVARGLATHVARRVDAWASWLTRFDPGSELMHLNASPESRVEVGPTLAAVLGWAREADARSGGIVDVALFDERIAAQRGAGLGTELHAAPAPWDVGLTPRGGTVARPPGLHLDLDGVAKGWLADRALSHLRGLAGAIVDADGDIALRVAPDDWIEVGLADPRTQGALLASLQLSGAAAGRFFGIATSGITVHRWDSGDAGLRHHLIDPRTRRPAQTDVLQCTVLAATARDAEVLAKTAVILGCAEGLAFLDRGRTMAALILTDAGECLATPATLPWLAAA
jgi:thiamine biosynthesis lipoprotein